MKKIIYVLVFLLALIITRVFLIAIYTVNQNSMNNTFDSGDKVLMLKTFYKIDRGDILIFNRADESLIKRCIGLPGDSIKIAQKRIFINNDVVKSPERAIENNHYKKDVFTESMIYDAYGSNWNPSNFGYYLIPKKGTKITLNEKNLSLYKNLILLENNDLEILKQSYYIFKNDYFYMIGDNRSQSIDSRFFGPVNSSSISGKVIYP